MSSDAGLAPLKRALISVSDKTGIVEFAVQLNQLGVEILSTGGTYKLLKQNNLEVTEVSDYTGFFLSDGGPGRLIESATTVEIFTNPKQKRTEDYVSGRFG